MDHSKFRKLLSITLDQEYGPILVLEDLEHRDYIEDVLCEHYDIEYEYMTEDNASGKNTLYFGPKANVGAIQRAIEKINYHHSTQQELYSVI